MDDWELNEEGNLAVVSVVAWNSAVAGSSGLLRIVFVRGEEQLEKQEFEAFQMGMSGAQARLLAEDLLQIANRIDETESGATH